jgi:hypothetical protein
MQTPTLLGQLVHTRTSNRCHSLTLPTPTNEWIMDREYQSCMHALFWRECQTYEYLVHEYTTNDTQQQRVGIDTVRFCSARQTKEEDTRTGRSN